MTSDSTLWSLGDQTPGKHLVLRNYLNAWLPILGQSQERILFIDGFAGPGEYEGGEPGSPIIALRTLKEHAARERFGAEINFLFVELDPERARHLETLVAAETATLPPRCTTNVVEGRFDATITTLLDDIEVRTRVLAPCFLMVDPFGISDTPMSIIERILRHPKSEVYISFMYEPINRFKTTAEFAPHLDALFGCSDWREGVDINDPRAKKDYFYELYRRQLKKAGAKHVVHFELYKGNRLIYAIFFGTKHLLGCDRMKRAIWKVAPFGDYAFRGSRDGQLALEFFAVNLAALAKDLSALAPHGDWISMEHATEFAESDMTEYHSGHLRTALASLEKDGHIEVDSASRKRKGTFPAGTRFRFK